MNVKLLRKIKKHILEEPKRLLMRTWIIRKSALLPKVSNRNFAKCGTAACIAGWACILAGADKEISIDETARKILGLDEPQSRRLFIYWPKKYNGGWSSKGDRKTALIAAARIEHFIRTEGRE